MVQAHVFVTRACATRALTPWSVLLLRAQRLMNANPNSFRKLVATFLEANGRGYWEAKPEQIEKLKQLYMDVEDKIEGIE